MNIAGFLNVSTRGVHLALEVQSVIILRNREEFDKFWAQATAEERANCLENWRRAFRYSMRQLGEAEKGLRDGNEYGFAFIMSDFCWHFLKGCTENGQYLEDVLEDRPRQE